MRIARVAMTMQMWLRVRANPTLMGVWALSNLLHYGAGILSARTGRVDERRLRRELRRRGVKLDRRQVRGLRRLIDSMGE